MMPKKPEGYGAWLKLDKPEHIVGFLLKSLQHTLRQSMDEALRKRGFELSFAHFVALFGLFCEPGITGAALARRAMVSAQTMNSALRRLELEGRIERRPHPDSRRADSWWITPEGLELLEQAREVGDAIFERMLAPLDRAEIAALESSLRRCIAALESGVEDDVADVAAPERRRRGRSGKRPAAHAEAS
jgi:DNA-binding MarR family transcriptional regulator